MACAANILVVDDEESMRIACAQTLMEEGYRVQEAENGQRGLAMTERESFDLVLLDLKMPGISGMEVLRHIKEEDPSSVVIVITGHGTIDVAVQAMREGAFDFITKPFPPDTLVSAVKRAIDSHRRAMEHVCVTDTVEGKCGLDRLIGRSQAIGKVVDLIKQVAPTDSTVLLHGETGVGKELVARTIHHLSARREQRFVVVDCGSLVESLFESEMFGHVEGAFTGAIATTQGKFAAANGGTIFLDEIANISLNMQARLLRVIQEKEVSRVGTAEKIRVDVRIISATNTDLMREIQQGRFRPDLFYRLNVVPIQLPPLRERREDISILADYFLAKSSLHDGRSSLRISPEAMRFLRQYDWPGNIRQLKNVLECATVTCKGTVITMADLALNSPGLQAEPGDQAPDGALAESEKREIVKALRQFDGHRSKAAEHLGINRKTLREKMRKYGLDQ